jgi:hypothetical protein
MKKMVPIPSMPTMARFDDELRRHRRFKARRHFMHRAVRWPAVKALRKVIRPLMTPVSPLVARISRNRYARKAS